MVYSALITTDELAQILLSPELVIVDCRFSLKDTQYGHAAYQQTHIPGARYAHLDDDLSGIIIPGETGRHPLPDRAAFIKRLGNWGINPFSQVVAYDDAGGPYAARLWSMLKWLGHDAVAVLDGGWPKWLQEGRPTNASLPAINATEFVAHDNPGFLASVTEVEAATQDPQISLLDARATERFAGITEPIDAIAGHIPSAQSFPWMDNLADNKCFLQPAVLKKRFASVDTASAISYCGSGVTAAHNMLAMAHAGLPLTRLYAGSWSEWITSPNHKIATGLPKTN